MDTIFEIVLEAVVEILDSVIADKNTSKIGTIICLLILIIPLLVICGFVTYCAIKTFMTDMPRSIILLAVVAFIIGICIYIIVHNMKKIKK